jgi:isoaspartyl peptidase/L-asparaginase-like protein (Ntn-hydrolase superfamily)
MTPAAEKQYRDDIEKALQAGYDGMQKPGGTALDGVVAAINVMEDSGRFNAGKGACYNREGRHELNASIMEGKTKKAGAVGGLTRVKNPITAARLVMEKSDHVFLIGEGAERFLLSQNLPEASPLYFWTELQWQRLMDAQQKERKAKGSAAAPSQQHFGTVGAVALDKDGNLAAGTSTGGIMNKLPGRLGDSPVIGAGTYADNGRIGRAICRCTSTPSACRAAMSPRTARYTSRFIRKSRRHSCRSARHALRTNATSVLLRRISTLYGFTTTSPVGPRNSISSEFSTSRPRMRSSPTKSACSWHWYSFPSK